MYGLHRQDNLIFLHEQGGAARCLSPGLATMESPFTIRERGWFRCPHQLGTPEPGRILKHPLVRAMGPDQDGGLYFVNAVHAQWLWRLASMTPSAPNERFIEPYWGLAYPRPRKLAPKLVLTNVAPLVITDWLASDFGTMEQLAALPRTRNFILCGPLPLRGSIHLDPTGLKLDHDWAREGRRQLYHLIRKS